MDKTEKFKRHWSFIVCDPLYLYPITSILLLVGFLFANIMNDPEQLLRIGNFIIGVGVWMSMRSTLRNGLKKETNYNDNFPVIPNKGYLNSTWFNERTFEYGDAKLQIHGFVITIIGSIFASYGDYIFSLLFSV